MRLTALATVPAVLTACGARTSFDDSVAASVTADAGAIEGGDASGMTSTGVLCALVDGIVSSCNAAERAGPVQRCEPSEQCMPQMIPNADVGYHTVYECCVGAPEKTLCVARQFSASYVCQ